MNQKLDDFFEKVITVKWGPDRESVDIIDQTLLPGTIKRIQIRTQEEIWEAIKKLRVRGAPAIGVCAAYGIAVVANQFPDSDYQDFAQRFHEAKEYLASSRPTAVNLFWALNRMEDTLRANVDQPVASIKEILYREAEAIRDELPRSGLCRRGPFQPRQ